MPQIKFDVADLSLSLEGHKKILWSAKQMPVLRTVKERFSKEKPFKNLTISACLHVTSETANLLLTLKAGGAKVVVCASNLLSTQDSVTASLVKDYQIPTFAIRGEDNKKYYQHLNAVLDYKPNLTMDDGGDLIFLLHTNRRDLLPNIIGSSEETTTGVTRLMAMEKERALKIPIIGVNESKTKYLFDNRYGTGQSTIDSIMRSTNMLLAGKKFVVCGYGWCGRGIAMRAKGMGAYVIITEVNPIMALEAAMDGFAVMKLEEAVKFGEVFVSSTGNKHVINVNNIMKMNDGAVLANAGHFDVEIDMAGLNKITKSKQKIRTSLDEYVLTNGKKVYVIGEGRLANLAAAEGHPAEVMDLSFTNQALAAEYLVKNKGRLKARVYTLPEDLDREVAMIKLASMGISIDELTAEQKKYLTSWIEGTK